MTTDSISDAEAILIAEGAVFADAALTLQAWQRLIDTGLCRSLGGYFSRVAADLIGRGLCVAG